MSQSAKAAKNTPASSTVIGGASALVENNQPSTLTSVTTEASSTAISTTKPNAVLPTTSTKKMTDIMPSPRFVSGSIGGYYLYVDSNPAVGNELKIWTIAPANLNYFIDVAGAGLEPATSSDVVVAQTESKGGSASVSRYPGDPKPFNRANKSKKIMKNRTVRHGRALPGRSFTLDDGTELRQFTYQGDLRALHALLVGHLKMDVKFTHYNGAWEMITAPEGGD